MKSLDKNSPTSNSVPRHTSISSTSLADENDFPPVHFHSSIDYPSASLDNENEDQDRNYDEGSINEEIQRAFRLPSQSQLNSIEARRPGPEWVYPNDYAGSYIDIDNESTAAQHIQRDSQSSSDSSSTAYIINPSQTIVIPTIDGVVVPHKRCYLKICGIRIFDDEFPLKINAILLLILLLIIAIVGIVGGILNSPTKNTQLSSINQSSTIIPSMAPSNAPSEVLDIRGVNITETLFNTSGPSILETNTPQNKALTWILDEDGMNLTYSSHNLVQRYALMVLYYSLSGEKWVNNEGYGSDKSECNWFGIRCNPSKIASIILENNGLEGELVKEVGLFSKSQIIRLQSNKISGSIPTEIGMLAKLQRLDVSGNDLSGTIPDEMRNCKNIQMMDIASNRISGTIPSYLGELRFLQSIDFMSNQLIGTIPSNLSNLPVLVTLFFFDNKLTGTLPPELGLCQFLDFLDLGKNSLTGTIPSSLGNIAFLKELLLEKNMLSGNIPETLGSLAKLTEIDLSNNMINGTMPLSFDNLDDLEVLHLHNNMISGAVSEKVCELSLRELTADCAGMEAEVSCSCCTTCF